MQAVGKKKQKLLPVREHGDEGHTAGLPALVSSEVLHQCFHSTVFSKSEDSCYKQLRQPVSLSR